MSGIIQRRNKSRGLHLNNDDGLTLIELLVYMVISGILMGVSVTAFLAQNKTYNSQDIIAETQQNIRGAISMMVPEIRLAGFDPADKGAGFTSASQNQLSFDYWKDTDKDGDYDDEIVQKITYDLSDADADGDTDIVRNPADPPVNPDLDSILAENIDQLRFEYLYWNYNSEAWIWANDSATIEADLGVSADKALEMIQAVKIIVLGGARDSIFATTDTTVYKPPLEGSGAGTTWTPAADSGSQRLASVVVQCRNS